MNSGPSYPSVVELICSFFVSFPLCSLCPPMRIMFFPILMWECGFGGGRNNRTKLVLYHGKSLQIFPYRKGIFFTGNKLLEWKSRWWFFFFPRIPVSMFPWLWVLLKWEGGEARQRVGLGRRRLTSSHHRYLIKLPESRSLPSTVEHLSIFYCWFPFIFKMSVRSGAAFIVEEGMAVILVLCSDCFFSSYFSNIYWCAHVILCAILILDIGGVLARKYWI